MADTVRAAPLVTDQMIVREIAETLKKTSSQLEVLAFLMGNQRAEPRAEFDGVDLWQGLSLILERLSAEVLASAENVDDLAGMNGAGAT
jgi:hypothetical protein